jgi:hypothetical protein
MNSISFEDPLFTAKHLIEGATLIEVRVLSSSLSLRFGHYGSLGNAADSWVEGTGFFVVSDSGSVGCEECSSQWLSSKQLIIGQICMLLGEDVTSVEIRPDGMLSIGFSEKVLLIGRDESSVEEVWWIEGNSRLHSKDTTYRVLLEDSGSLTSRKLPGDAE